MTDQTLNPAVGGSAVVARGLGKKFDGTWVVRDVDLDVPDGTILGVIGPSGCGKTTTVRMANGVLTPDGGSVQVLGKDPLTFSAAERTRLGYLPQSPVLFESLSLWDNLNYYASLNGVRLRRKQRLHELLELVDLGGHERKLISEASGGMKRRIALAATMVHRPRLLMLDEPTAGIDPVLRRRFWEHFRNLRDQGSTLVVTTQYVGEAADCDLVVMLAAGETIAIGTPDELRREAFGGEIIEIELLEPIQADARRAIAALDGIHAIESTGPRRLRLVADDGGVVLTRVLEHLTHTGRTVVDSEEVVPTFDDVFIKLVEKREAATADGAEPETAGRP